MSVRYNAYVQGYEDHNDGATRCPYALNTGLADAWQTGWDEAAAHAASAEALETTTDAD